MLAVIKYINYWVADYYEFKNKKVSENDFLHMEDFMFVEDRV